MNERAGIWCEKHCKFSEGGACGDCAATPPVPVETPAIPPMLSLADVARGTPMVPVIEAVCERNQHLPDGPMTAIEVMKRHATFGAELGAAGERAMEGMQEFLKEKILDLRPLLERIRKAETRRAWGESPVESALGDMRELVRIANIDDAPPVPLSPPSVFREMLRLLTRPTPYLEDLPCDRPRELRCRCRRYATMATGYAPGDAVLHTDDVGIKHTPQSCRGEPVMISGIEVIPDATVGPYEIRMLPAGPRPSAYDESWWKSDAALPKAKPRQVTCFCARWHFGLQGAGRTGLEKITKGELHTPDRCGRTVPMRG